MVRPTLGRAGLARGVQSGRSVAEGHLSVGWLVAALATHVALLGAGHLRDESGAIVRAMREAIRAQLAQFEIPVETAPPPPPPEPEPEPEPEEPPPPPPPTAQQAPPPKDDPYDAPPKEAPQPPSPEPMEAQPVLVQDGPPDPSAVTFVTGEGRGVGFVSTWGRGTRPARRPPVPGGGGAPPPPPPPPKPDRSRPASLEGERSWDCGFPSEADAAGIRSAVVSLRIIVRPSGRPQKIEVLSDPGHGFGAQARQCAKERRYQPALDRDGNPTKGTLSPVRIRFTR